MVVKGVSRMLSLILLSLVAVVNFICGWSHRLLCATALIIPFLLHWLFLSNLGGEYFTMEQAYIYYVGSMGLSMLTIGLLGLIKGIEKTSTHSQMVIHLQFISLLFLIANFSGFFLWYSYLPVDVYQSLCVILSLLEVARLLIKTDGDKKDGIDSRGNNWLVNASQRRMGSNRERL